MRCVRASVLTILLVMFGSESVPAGGREGQQGTQGIAPQDDWTCPASHPIKATFSTYSGERCIYHVPGSVLYGLTLPQRCYATEEEAQRDGCRKAKR